MADQFSRTRRLFGSDNMDKLKAGRVIVFGVGGVGGYVCEALARAGIGAIDIVDNDTVSITNINRQIIALHSTVGRLKVDVMAERIADINPECKVKKYTQFYLPENKDEFDFTQYDYVVDAIDTVAGKIAMVLQANEAGVPIISSMGTGNKIHPEMLEISDIYKTSVCPLAKVMRHELKKRNVRHLTVLYSKEIPLTPVEESDEVTNKRSVPSSTSFVPPTGGLLIAAHIVRELLGI
ncbi:MAG: ThiF family adenylyltransferase [Lachnospira sp.]